MKAATASTTDGLVATAPSVQTLIGTKRLERISTALNFSMPLYTFFLQLQSYIDASSALVEAFLWLLVDIESSDEGSYGVGMVHI